MASKKERRKWALTMAAALLHSDMDNFDASEGDTCDEDEQDKRREAVRAIADELEAKAKRITLTKGVRSQPND